MSTHCVQTIKKLNFEDLLERDGSVSIHHQNIRFLAIEMFKVFKDVGPQIVRRLEMQCLTN